MSMMRRLAVGVCLLTGLGSVRLATADTIIVDRSAADDAIALDGFSSPSVAPFPPETYIVGGSFRFAGVTGTLMRTVGAYMQRYGNGSTPFNFLVFGDDMGRIAPAFFPPQTPYVKTISGPDYLTDGRLSLTLVTARLDTPVSLTSGNRYWIAASTLPFSGPGTYLVGLQRGGTGVATSSDLGGRRFDYDPALSGFDLDIYASGTDPIPEPATITLVGVGLLVWMAARNSTGVERRPRRSKARGVSYLNS
jgi:PEP-CTERM motif